MSLGGAIALVADRIVEPVEETHRAIARRWFEALGVAGRPVRPAHDTVVSLVYKSIRFGGSIVGAGLDASVTLKPSNAASVQAFLNGLWGDTLGRYHDRLAITMGMRDRDGSPIGPPLGAAFSAATGRLVILVHGMGETETCWRGKDSSVGLVQALEDRQGLTPVSIRYNTGLRVSANGSQLASLLESVHSEWPVPVQSIALVGNSMGGLVIRGACQAAEAAGHRWIDDVSDVVTLGTPHRGVPLEKLTNVVAWTLSAVPETRPLADFLNSRSVGIKDLRFGATSKEDWFDADPDALLLNTVGDHPLPPHLDHHFVAGVITADPLHPIGVMVGDLVVRGASATGLRRLDPTNVMVLGGLNHHDLPREPEVIDQVMNWVG